MGILSAPFRGWDAFTIATAWVDKVRRDMLDERNCIGTDMVGAHHIGGRRKRQQDKGVIVEIARVIDRLVVKVKAPGETAVGKPRRPPQEIKSEYDRLLGAGHTVSSSCGKYIGLARRDAQAPKRRVTLKRGCIEMFVEGAALPVDAVREPQRPSVLGEPT
jgi:hypothetical protein